MVEQTNIYAKELLKENVKLKAELKDQFLFWEDFSKECTKRVEGILFEKIASSKRILEKCVNKRSPMSTEVASIILKVLDGCLDAPTDVYNTLVNENSGKI